MNRHHLALLLVLPLAGCMATPVVWVGLALIVYGMLLGMYPDR